MERCGVCSWGRVLDVESNSWVLICAYLTVTNWVILFESFHLPGPPPFSFIIFKGLDQQQEYSRLRSDSIRRCWGAYTDARHILSWNSAIGMESYAIWLVPSFCFPSSNCFHWHKRKFLSWNLTVVLQMLSYWSALLALGILKPDLVMVMMKRRMILDEGFPFDLLGGPLISASLELSKSLL